MTLMTMIGPLLSVIGDLNCFDLVGNNDYYHYDYDGGGGVVAIIDKLR